jgi:16S rRNA (guanine527-N7)-methyltransferase
MTEDDARVWLADHMNVSRETWGQLEKFVGFLQGEAQLQNLISTATLDQIWARHIVDSAQLLRFAPPNGQWLDLGSGAGFPGLIVALLSAHHVTLVESRAKRIAYLQRAVELLDMQDRVTIAGMALEKFQTAPFSVISARAFAPLPRLLPLAHRFSADNTIWLLPKGRNAATELQDVTGSWKHDLRIEPSVTDDAAGILVGTVAGQHLSGRAKGHSVG